MELKNISGKSILIQTNTAKLVTNPTEKILKNVNPDIILESGKSEFKSENAYTVTYPGEYEMKDVFIHGILAQAEDVNPDIFIINTEDIYVAYIEGSVSKMSKELMEEIGVIHVLFYTKPAGKFEISTIGEIVNKIEPNIFIPIGFEKDEIDELAKSIGIKAVENESKLKLKSEDFSDEEAPIRMVLLNN